MKRYLLLLAHPADSWTDASAEQRDRWHAAHLDFHEQVGRSLVAGEALESPDTATTLHHRGGTPVLADGPFVAGFTSSSEAGTTEVLGGFHLVEATDLDQVTGWCALLPDCYSVEIRPCVAVAGFDG